MFGDDGMGDRGEVGLELGFGVLSSRLDAGLA